MVITNNCDSLQTHFFADLAGNDTDPVESDSALNRRKRSSQRHYWRVIELTLSEARDHDQRQADRFAVTVV